MPNDFRLLLDAIASKRLARPDCISVSAKGVAGEGKVDAVLMLPDMRHFVNEQPLPVESLFTEIIAIETAFRMQP